MDRTSVKKVLANNIRLLRTKKRFSQEAVAELANIGQNQISEIENERSNPNLETIIKIAQALDVEIVELFKKD
jgi:transcriptional regulator with XRE-family HTH domain